MSKFFSNNFVKHNTYLRFVNGITINNIFKLKTSSPYENNFKSKNFTPEVSIHILSHEDLQDISRWSHF